MITRKISERTMHYIINMHEVKERIKLYQHLFRLSLTLKKEPKVKKLRNLLSNAINHLKSLYKALQRGYNDYQQNRPLSKGALIIPAYFLEVENYLKENWQVTGLYGKIPIYTNPHKTKYTK